jgi:hypothetical protein
MMHTEDVKQAMHQAKGHVPGTHTHHDHKAAEGRHDTTGSGSHGSHKAIAGSALKTQIKGLIPGTIEHDIKKSRE